MTPGGHLRRLLTVLGTVFFLAGYLDQLGK